MHRIPEPDLMDTDEQALAYAQGQFDEPHNRFVSLFGETFPGLALRGHVLDLGCGPADVTLRFARAYRDCRIDGVDGALAMLHYGQQAVAVSELGGRVRLLHGYLPGAQLPRERYDAVISNSLLHHLEDPHVLWECIHRYAAPGAPVFVMDLMRPESVVQAELLLETYAANEPPILRQDFFNSLLAAYRVPEVAAQLASAGLARLEVRAVSDRHLTVSGHAPG